MSTLWNKEIHWKSIVLYSFLYIYRGFDEKKNYHREIYKQPLYNVILFITENANKKKKNSFF